VQSISGLVATLIERESIKEIRIAAVIVELTHIPMTRSLSFAEILTPYNLVDEVEITGRLSSQGGKKNPKRKKKIKKERNK
jgi:hypothetical protein